MSDIKHRTKIGILWNSFEKFLVQFIAFILNIILARLLTPYDFGIIGLLAVFLTLSGVFVESGFTKALIQNLNRNETDFSTVFFSNLFISILLYILLFFLAPYISEFYCIDELTIYSRVLFFVLILNSLSIVQSSILQIKVEFKKIAIINTVSTLVSGILAIVFAYKGFGAWAIIIKSISGSCICCIMYWGIGRWYPKMCFSIKSFKKLFGYGSKLLLGRIISETYTLLNDLIIGRYYKPEGLGIYTKSKQFPEISAGTLNAVLTGSTFPLLASMQNNKLELIATLRKMISITSLVLFPFLFGMSVLAEPVVLLFLGEKWVGAIPILRIMSFSYLFLPITCLNANILQVTNNLGKFLVILAINFIIKILTIIITVRFSMYAVVIGLVVNSLIYYILHAILLGVLFDFGVLKQMRCYIKYLLVSFLMAIFVSVIITFISSFVLKVLAAFIIGTSFYGLILFFMRDEYLQLLFSRIGIRFNKAR